MKKSILLLLPAMMVLASCNNGGEAKDLTKGSIFNEKVMANTFAKSGLYKAGTEVKINQKNSLGLGTSVQAIAYLDAMGESTQWAVVTRKNSEEALIKNVYDFASNKYLTNDWILATKFLNPVISTEVNGDLGDVHFITLRTKNGDDYHFQVFDEFGSAVYNFVSSVSASTLAVDEVEVDEKHPNNEFRSFELSAQDKHPVVVTYDLTGKMSKEEANKGEFLDGWETLEDFGHPELKWSQGDDVGANAVRVVIYNTKENKYVSSFAIPTGASSYLAGEYFVYQEKIALEERATEYDVYVGGNKFDLNTVRVNITNGAEEVLPNNFYLGAGASKRVIDEDKIAKYEYLSNVRVIREDRALDPVIYGKILDEKFEEVADVTGIQFDQLKVFEDKYYAPNGILYNANLEEVGYVPGLRNGLNGDKGHIFNVGAYFGLVNKDGKIVLPAVYEQIQELANGSYLISDEGAKFVVAIEGENTREVFDLTAYENVALVAGSAYLTGTKTVSEVLKTYLINIENGNATEIKGYAEGEVLQEVLAFNTHLGLDSFGGYVTKNVGDAYSYYYSVQKAQYAYYE